MIAGVSRRWRSHGGSTRDTRSSGSTLHHSQTPSLASSHIPHADRWQRDMQPTDFTSPLPPLPPYQASDDARARPSGIRNGVNTDGLPPSLGQTAAASSRDGIGGGSSSGRNFYSASNTVDRAPTSHFSKDLTSSSRQAALSVDNSLSAAKLRSSPRGVNGEIGGGFQLGSSDSANYAVTNGVNNFVEDPSLAQHFRYDLQSQQAKQYHAKGETSNPGLRFATMVNRDDNGSSGARTSLSSTGLTGSTRSHDPAADGSAQDARAKKPFDPARDLNPATPAPPANTITIPPPPPPSALASAEVSVDTVATPPAIAVSAASAAVGYGDGGRVAVYDNTGGNFSSIYSTKYDRASFDELETIPEAVRTTSPTRLYKTDAFPTVPPNRYQLEIIEHPRNARATTWGSKDRRMVTPPPILKLTIRDFDIRSEADRKLLTWPYNVVHVTLWKCPHGAGSDLAECYEATELNYAVNPNEGGLHGSLVASPFVLETPFIMQNPGMFSGRDERKVEQSLQQQGNASNNPTTTITTVPSCFFIFSDLSCHSRGIYRLRFELTHIDQSLLQAGGHSPTVAHAWSQPFEVYSAKDYPGVEPSSALLTYFKNHGALVTLRKGQDPRQRRKKRVRTSTTGGSDARSAGAAFGDFDSDEEDYDDY